MLLALVRKLGRFSWNTGTAAAISVGAVTPIFANAHVFARPCAENIETSACECVRDGVEQLEHAHLHLGKRPDQAGVGLDRD